MADLNIDKQGSDLFSLGSNFKAQDSSADVQKTVNEALDDVGSIHARDESDTTTRSRVTYTYVGTNLGTDLIKKVGEVVNSIHVDTMEIVFAAQQAVRVSFEGHNHAQNAHAAAGSGEYDGYEPDLAALVGSAAGFDVPTAWVWTNSNADSDLIGLTLRFSVDHTDAVKGNGDHAVGNDSRGLVTVTAEYIGVPVLTTTGWNLESNNTTDANQDFDKKSVTGSKALTRTTA